MRRWHGGRPALGFGHEIGPEAGNIYTLREVGFLHPFAPNDMAVRLVEIRNPVLDYLGAPTFEPSFAAKLFRPVQTRATDISIFTAMLTGANEREPG